MSDNSATDSSLYGAVGTAVTALNTALAAAAADGIWINMTVNLQSVPPGPGVTPMTQVVNLVGGHKIVVYGSD